MWNWLKNLFRTVTRFFQRVVQGGQPGGEVGQPPPGEGGQGESSEEASDNVEDNGYDPVAAEAARKAAEEQRRQAELDEKAREFERWREMYGSQDAEPLGEDPDLATIGDSVQNSAEGFLNFIRGEVTDDVTVLTQIRDLFNEIGNTLIEIGTPDPVNEGLSNAGMEWIFENLGVVGSGVLTEVGAAEVAIQMIEQRADRFYIDMGDTQGLTTEETVARYLQLLNEQQETFGVSAATTDEVQFMTGFIQTFGISDEITLDTFEWARNNLDGVDYDDPDGLENALRSHLVTGINIYMPNPEGVDLEALSLRDLANFHQWVVLNAFDDALDEANEIPNAQLYWNYLQAQDIQHPIWGSAFSTPDEQTALLSAEGALEGNPEYLALMEQYKYHIEGIGSDLQQSQSLLAAFEGNYEPEVPPDMRLLRMALSFWEPLDYALTIPEIAQDISEGDWQNALGNSALLIIPGLSGWMNDAAKGSQLAPGQQYAHMSGGPLSLSEVSQTGRINDIASSSGLFRSSNAPLRLAREINVSAYNNSTGGTLSESELARITQERLGRPLSFHELAALSGAYFAEDIRIVVSDSTINIYASGSQIDQWAVTLRGRDGNVTLYSNDVHLNVESRGQGLGSRSTIVQIEAAARLGIDTINARATSGIEGNTGYYWAFDVGFNAAIPNTVALPEQFRSATTFQELYALGGRDWWIEYGRTNRSNIGVELDISDSQTLERLRNLFDRLDE